MKDKKKRGLILSILGLVCLVLITAGVTYAFFNYAKEGTTENVITTGTITFIYEEIDRQGAGISIEDAYPVSDTVGMAQTNTFNFKVKSETTSAKIPYTVTARMKNTSTLSQEAVRIYLTEVVGENETQLLLDNYDNLNQTTITVPENTVEKVIYTDTVPANSNPYEKNFRLRMWIDEDVDFSDGTMNDKEFTVTINVYANARVVTQEEIDYESSTEITTLTAGDVNLTKVEGQDYDYEATLPEGTTSTTISIETENPNATVNVEKIDSLVKANNMKRLALTKELELTEGLNYFKVTITSENNKTTTEYKIKIYMGPTYTEYSIGAAVTAKDGSKWHVLENSDKYSEYVTLLSDYNLNSDGTYNTECGKDINNKFICSPMAFDPDTTNTYDETDSNNIGYFIKNTYESKVLSALPGTTDVTIPTAEQIAIADGKTFEQKSLALTSPWLKTTSYWTKTSNSSNDYIVWYVFGFLAKLYDDYADVSSSYGARPVITTLKSNLLAE